MKSSPPVSNIPFNRQHIDLTDVAAIIDTIESGVIVRSGAVTAFEVAFSTYLKPEGSTDSLYSIAVNSGTTALEVALRHLMTSKFRSAVLLPSITYAATAHAIVQAGGIPYFYDVDDKTLVLDCEKLVQDLEDNSGLFAGIVVVQHTGMPIKNMGLLRDFADKRGMFILEDACHAIGTIQDNEKVGSCKYSDAACFSFHPQKIITTGEGGMIVTKNKVLYDKMFMYVGNGIEKGIDKANVWKYDVVGVGTNIRMSGINAALGLSQMGKIERFLAQRLALSSVYRSRIEYILQSHGVTLQSMVYSDEYKMNNGLFIIQLEDRDDLRGKLYSFLLGAGIQANVHYTPLHLTSYYSKYAFVSDMAVSNAYARTALTLPLYPLMSENDAVSVVDRIHLFFNQVQAC